MTNKKNLVVLVLVGVVVVALSTGMLAVESAETGVAPPVTVIPALKNASVSPAEGNWSDYFNYSVDISFYKKTKIELWIYHPAEHDWTFGGIREYNASEGNWQTLRWNVQPFNRNCEGDSSSYKFTWNGTVLKIGDKKRFFGPRIKVPPQWAKFRHGTVSCEGNATYKTEFNYSIEVNASKTMDIELVVYDPCLRSWTSVEEYKTYLSGEKGGWQMLTWNNTKPFIRTKCKEGLAKFKFNAYYEGERVNNSEIYEGPSLIPLLEFRNPKVEPPDGSYNSSFNYSVKIANVTEHVNISEIKLEVLNPHTLNWTTYNQTNSTNNTLIWHVRPFEGDPECRGTARYRFIYDDDVWPEMVPYYGPEIKPPPPELKGWVESTTAERNLSKEECIEYYVHTGYVTPFNFTATSKNTDLDLELLIRDLETGNLERRGGPQHCKAGKNVTWSYITPFDSISADKIKGCIGKRVNFTFMYQGQVYKEEFKGPELLVAFKNPKYPTSVSYGENFNYSIDVIGSRALNITLEYQNKGNWISDNVSPPEWNYTDIDIGNWTRHTWNCKAMKEWEDVRFRWWEKGNETKAAEMTSLELGVSQLSASKPKRSCPVPVIV